MKNINTLLITLLCGSLSFNAFAQITIEANDIMQPGDTFLIHYDQTPEITIDGSMLTDHTWDYTHLTDDSTNFACYAPSDELDFADEFPESNFYTYGPGFMYAGPGGGSPSASNFGYMMFISNENGMFVDGFYSDYGYGWATTYNEPDEILISTPNNYSDVVESNSHWTVSIDAEPMDQDTIYKSFTIKTLTTDAWGSLSCPFGTYDVLRIHEHGYTVDSLYIVVAGMTVYTEEVQQELINRYTYWAEDVRHPLITLYLDVDDNVTRADYLYMADYVGISDKNETKSLEIFPNPAKNMIHINHAVGKVKIYNALGQCLMNENLGINKTINIHNLDSGIYIVMDESGQTKRFVKE